ncbi:hypothetical protein [Kitasatospora sp. NPDC047058]|uniref:hypothetical protein n=1 Tax=Kitasatospora sp. NPDC047058 TaxID=3155620 RepID=UPI0033CF2184
MSSFSRRSSDARFEAEQHRVMDSNLAQLRQADPDLNRIFQVTFGEAHRSGLGDRLRQQLEAYAALTHQQGRMQDYHALFAGLDN